MSLTGILNSSLFHIENMGNSIYRIYPLFYCNNIVCSDDDNRILDTRCIIAILKNSETFFSFINNPDGSIYDFSNESYYPAYSIEDNLSMNDFNRLVYILRKNTKHYDTLEIKNNILIKSDYGEYTFDLKDSTVSDEGIIITPRTLGNACTVTLTNPVFINSRYYLHLKVKKINNINLCADDNNPIVTSEIIVPLVRNVPVEIPFTDIELYDVISFDASVEIVHSEPILLHEARITLNANTEHIDLGESVILNAVYDDESSVAGKTIVFKANGTVIGSSVTNNLGVATLTYTPASTGDLSISAEYENSITSNSVNVTVTKLSTVLSLESDVDSSIPSYPINLSGILEYQGTGLANKTIKIYDNNTLLDTVVTDNTGAYNTIIYGTSNDSQLKAVFEGDSTYNISYSEIITIKDVSDNYMEMTVTGASFTSSQDSGVTPLIKTGTLLVDWGDNTVEVFNEPMQHNYEASGTYNIKLYGDLQGIGKNYFKQCNSIKNVILPGTVTSIDAHAFHNCYYLESIILSSNLESIGRGAFKYCDGLTNILIPNSVTNIAIDCFAYSTGLRVIELEWDSLDEIVQYNGYWISGTDERIYFLIPTGTTSLYTTKGYWEPRLREINSISLTSNKSILSKVDNEYATLSAQLTDNGSPVAKKDVNVTFEVRKVSDDSLVETLTGTTNANGVATVSYSGKGTGDLYVQAKINNISSNSVNLEDCIDYQPLTSNIHQSRWTIPSAVSSSSTFGYSNDGWKYGNASSFSSMYLNQEFTSPVSIEFKLTGYNGGSTLIGNISDSTDLSTNQLLFGLGSSNNLVLGDNISGQYLIEVNAVYRVEIYANELKFYKNNTLIHSKAFNTYNPFKICLNTGGGRWCQIKDLKIKPL